MNKLISKCNFFLVVVGDFFLILTKFGAKTLYVVFFC